MKNKEVSCKGKVVVIKGKKEQPVRGLVVSWANPFFLKWVRHANKTTTVTVVVL
jgi:hypothetical protein